MSFQADKVIARFLDCNDIETEMAHEILSLESSVTSLKNQIETLQKSLGKETELKLNSIYTTIKLEKALKKIESTQDHIFPRNEGVSTVTANVKYNTNFLRDIARESLNGKYNDCDNTNSYL